MNWLSRVRTRYAYRAVKLNLYCAKLFLIRWFRPLSLLPCILTDHGDIQSNKKVDKDFIKCPCILRNTKQQEDCHGINSTIVGFNHISFDPKSIIWEKEVIDLSLFWCDEPDAQCWWSQVFSSRTGNELFLYVTLLIYTIYSVTFVGPTHQTPHALERICNTSWSNHMYPFPFLSFHSFCAEWMGTFWK